MIFQREKALWRYASKNYAAATDGRTTNHPPPPQQRHPRLHPPPTVAAAAATGGAGWLATSTRPFAHCCRNTSDSSVADCQPPSQPAHRPATVDATPRLPPAHQAPPPYCSVSGGLDSSDMLCSTPHGYSVTGSYLLHGQQQPPRLPQYPAAEADESSAPSTGDLDTTDEYELKSQGQPQQRRLQQAAAEALWTGSRTNGYNCESSGDDMLVDETDQMQRATSNSNNNNNTILDSKPPPAPSDSLWSTTTAPHHGQQQQQQQQQQPATTTFVTSAANMFRNCCGRNCVDTSISSSTDNNNCSSSNSNSKGVHPLLATPPPATAAYQNADMKATTAAATPQYTPRQYFKALMKPLKSTQQTMLLKAVKSRLDHPACVRGGDMTAAATAASAAASSSSSACILIPRMKILDEEPYVITCRLFLWPDLSGATALKRLPLCPNERDPVYECCNPLHWCRILETDTAPPPYQKQTTMERLRREEIHSLQYPMANNNQTSSSVSVSGKNFSQSSISASYNSSSNWLQPGGRLPSPESFTTNDEDCRSSLHSATWCQVAYWELAQRVGDRHYAKKPSVNIYCDGPSSTIGDDMCLRDLVAKKTTASPEDVQHTRRKIGLGVTLSREADGVWLYNRSSESIFVYSPTVNESWFRVCKVETGDCLKAFDSQRAQNLVYPMNLPSAQLGPVDVFSIRISFAKGWGSTYKRQDITRCPCWLEVIFNQR